MLFVVLFLALQTGVQSLSECLQCCAYIHMYMYNWENALFYSPLCHFIYTRFSDHLVIKDCTTRVQVRKVVRSRGITGSVNEVEAFLEIMPSAHSCYTFFGMNSITDTPGYFSLEFNIQKQQKKGQIIDSMWPQGVLIQKGMHFLHGHKKHPSIHMCSEYRLSIDISVTGAHPRPRSLPNFSSSRPIPSTSLSEAAPDSVISCVKFKWWPSLYRVSGCYPKRWWWMHHAVLKNYM